MKKKDWNNIVSSLLNYFLRLEKNENLASEELVAGFWFPAHRKSSCFLKAAWFCLVGFQFF